MPTATFNASHMVSADDQDISRGTGYPPSGTITRGITSATVVDVERTLDVSYFVVNGLVRWDTSSLPDNAVVSAATLRIWVNSRTSANSLNLTAGWYAWDGTSSSDYTSTPETSALAGTALSSITTGASNDFILLSPASVSLSGYTSLRFHISQRAADAAPTGINQLQFRSFDHATDPEPQLIVTYELGGDLIGMVGI